MATKKKRAKKPAPAAKGDRVIRSVGFRRDLFEQIEERAGALDMKVCTFIQNAALKAAGVDVAEKARDLAASLEAV